MKFILSNASALLILILMSGMCGCEDRVFPSRPLPPSNLTGELVSSTQINLTWTDESINETGFNIERRLDGGSFIFVGTVNADTINFSDVGLTANTNYTYRVISFRNLMYSETYSNEWSINTSINTDVTICSQVWTTKNLDVSTYRNGDVIPQVTDPAQWPFLTTGAYCYYNNDSATYAATYGKFYNWHAVNDPRGLAPTGYHVPSEEEWTLLETCLGDPSIAGGKMKEVGLIHWLSPNIGATNSSGFTGLPGGLLNYNTFENFGSIGYWWSSTEHYDQNLPTGFAWYRGLGSNFSDVNRGYFPLNYGMSVRCIKD